MDTWSSIEIVGESIKIIGGLALSIGSRLKNNERPKWVLTALLIAGLSVAVSGLLYFARSGLGPWITAETLYRVKHFKTLLAGISLGALLTLFISGELGPRKWKS